MPLPKRKARALIGYLSMSDRLEEARASIVGMLWSDADEGHARGSLRQTLVDIRKALSSVGFEGLRADKNTIGFAPESVCVDLADVLGAVRSGQVHNVLIEQERAPDSILIDLEEVDDGFADWLKGKRQSIANALRHMLEDRMHADNIDSRVRLRHAQALLNLDPSNEEPARIVIGAAAKDGDTAKALAIYENLKRLLWESYECEPSEKTKALIGTIRRQHAAREPLAEGGTDPGQPTAQHGPARLVSAPGAGPVRQPIPRLVVSVMRFDMGEVREENHYRVQGFRRELIASLVHFREWLVCDPALTGEGPVRTGAGRQSEYLIEASAKETRDGLALTLTIREAGADSYLWSDRLKLSDAHWFEAQEVIVRRLATSLNVHISAERIAAIGDSEPSDLKAYDMWLLAQATLLRWDTKSWETARRLLLAVVGQLPNFAPAYSSLAQLNNAVHIAMPGIFRSEERTVEALGYSRRAAHLDPIDSRSQLCLGWSHALSGNYEQAAIYMSLAHDLNDNDPWTMISAANCLAFCAEYDKAGQMARHALSLPLSPSPLQWSYQTAIRFMIGDYEGCISAASAAGDDVNPNVPAWKTAALHHMQRADEAAAELRRFYALTRRRWVGSEPTDAEITRWLLHLFPIRRVEDWQRLRDGLAGAGAPLNGLSGC